MYVHNIYIYIYISVAYIGGPSGLQPPRNVSKKQKIILNVCYILLMLYSYLEFF
jgi:hypothetical protein